MDAEDLRREARELEADGVSIGDRFGAHIDGLAGDASPVAEATAFLLHELAKLNTRLLDLEQHLRIDEAPDSTDGDRDG